MAGRKALVSISPELLEEMLEFSKNPREPKCILQKKDDRTPKHTLRLNATEIEEFFKYRKAEAKEETEATNPSSGGYKKGKANAKDKYTVKELKRIASRNNIKTTKKLDGKTINLNKKGLMAKLKRKKLI